MSGLNWRKAALAAALCAALAGGCGSPLTEEVAEAPEVMSAESLRLGEIRPASLRPGGAASFPLELEAGEAVLLVVEQREVNVEVTVVDPGGQLRQRFDSPVGAETPERVCFIAEQRGTYRVGVSPVRDGSGNFSIKLERRRGASPQDRACQAAARALMAAVAVRKQGPPREVLEHYQTARALYRQAEEALLEFVTLKEMASLFAQEGEYTQAVGMYGEALAIVRSVDTEKLVVKLLNSLGKIHHGQGELGAARGAWEEAAQLARKAGDASGAATALNNLGRVAAEQGEPHQAAALYRQAIDLWRSEGSIGNEAVGLHNLADSYLMLERFGEAEDLLEEALGKARQTEWTSFEASVLTTLGWSRYRLGAPLEASELLEQALVLRRGIGDRLGEVGVLDRLGSVQRQLGRFEAAMVSYRGSLETSLEVGNLRHVARTRVNLGCLRVATGEPRVGMRALRTALNYFASHHDPDSRAHALFCLAQAERQLGQLTAAREQVEMALVTVDSLRIAARQQGAWHAPVEDWQDYAELYVKVLLELADSSGDGQLVAAAFEASDVARARSFYELLVESRVAVRSEADPVLLTREKEVQMRLDEVGDALLDATREERTGLERRSRHLALELETLRNEIRTSSPRFDPLLDPRSVGLAEIQGFLAPGTILLSYALGRERSYLFLVTNKSIEVFSLPPRSKIELEASRAYDGLQRSAFTRARERANAAGEELSKMLLAPARKSLAGDRLLVIAEGMLHYIPFAYLPWPGGDGDHLLLDEVEVVYLPSASVLAALRERSANRSRPPKVLAVLADAVFSLTDSRVQRVSPVAADAASSSGPETADYQRLEHTRREALAILELVPEELRLAALDFDASGELARSGELGHYEIVHLASHALIHEEIPELSEIVLSLVDSDGDPADGGRLRLHEIYSLQLPADLVVLSACRSALGKRVRGAGLLSFTRGLFYAGASRVLVSLWDVDDAATAELVIRFYQGLLSEGLEPATALRAAQLWMRRQPTWEAPYYWAGFVLQGEAE